jgi:hypothetical protein
MEGFDIATDSDGSESGYLIIIILDCDNFTDGLIIHHFYGWYIDFW